MNHHRCLQSCRNSVHFQKFRKSVIAIIQEFSAVPEILESVFTIKQDFCLPDNHESVIAIVEKFCVFPEILESVFTIIQENCVVPEIQEKVFAIIQEFCAVPENLESLLRLYRNAVSLCRGRL